MMLRNDSALQRMRMRLRLRLRSSTGGDVEHGGGRAGGADAPARSCPICLELVSAHALLAVGPCAHAACAPCMKAYLCSVARARRWPVPCVTCGKSLAPQACIDALAGTGEPAEALQNTVLARVHHDGRVRYCARRTCGAAFDFVPPDPASANRPDAFEVTCPLCSLTQCVQCTRPAHTGTSCADVAAAEAAAAAAGEPGTENDGTHELVLMAAANGWRRCPGCEAVCERDLGCNYVVCFCGCSFCAACGTKYVSRSRYRLRSNVHGVPGCSCGLYNT